MKRIAMHWTGGGHAPGPLDLASYHVLIDGDANEIMGDKPPEANKAPLGPDYVRHTGGKNTDTIGVAVCGMFGAVESPLSLGMYPIKQTQVEELARVVANLCEIYKIPVSRETTFTHAEVGPMWGVGRYKWDITWLPGMSKTGDPIEVGDKIRDMIRREMRPAVRVPVNPFSALAAFLAKLFSRPTRAQKNR